MRRIRDRRRKKTGKFSTNALLSLLWRSLAYQRSIIHQMVSKKSGLKPRLYSFYYNRIWDHSCNKCAWCVPQKSIGGAVGVTLGNVPYKIGDRTGVFQKKREICHLAGLIAERQEKRNRSLLSLCLIVKV